MNTISERERITQGRVVKHFRDVLGYDYLGNWQYRENSNVEEDYLVPWLKKQGVANSLITKVLTQLDRTSAFGAGKDLYTVNKDVYSLLRYGVKVKADVGDKNQTVWLIDWKNPENNHFGVAEEVTINGLHDKRPDVVLYVNGIALGVLELKRSTVAVGEGIRQNLDNQKKEFIRNYFTTIQLVMAGNDNAGKDQGLRYGVIETPQKHYYKWKSAPPVAGMERLDQELGMLCNKKRLLELIHDFIVFDQGRKKVCRHNQYYGVAAAQERLKQDEGGIIWHTQGSGKTLLMIWLAKWIRENIENSRVLIITDRTELDEQIENRFKGVSEKIVRSGSGRELIDLINKPTPWLMGSLVHKFGSQAEDDDEQAADEYIEEVKRSLPSDFAPKGKLFVFVDECHRTQSGKLHAAMKSIIPKAIFIGFTGTPLLKRDKQRSIEVFGSYIHTYKYTDAVKDGVVLDLLYEARDIDQRLTDQKKIDQWFDVKTQDLNDYAKTLLKKRWATLQKILSAKDRLSRIVSDIYFDMDTRNRLVTGEGNAMLVCDSIYQACRVYEMFQDTELKGKCAIVSSYKPSHYDLKGQESGEGQTEKLLKYDVYRRMLAQFFGVSEEEAANRVEDFELKVKEQFVKEPGRMRLLIVVDKLLTGFDAPPATYLYIDKKMRDHGLFQAICRVNRLDGDKKYGYIIDYKDLFHHLERAIKDYASGAFDQYDANDIKGILSDRLQKTEDRLESAREKIKALCETVEQPKGKLEYIRYFCGKPENKDDLKETEPRRLDLYKYANALISAYSDIATEMSVAGYSPEDQQEVKAEVEHYSDIQKEIKLASGDYVDLPFYDPAMRRLLDTYIRAEETQEVFKLEDDAGIAEFVLRETRENSYEDQEENEREQEAVAEAIENNIRRVINDRYQVNPAYYEKMSEMLQELIRERREQAKRYKESLDKLKQLAEKVKSPGGTSQVDYPEAVDSEAKKAIYDNFGKDESLAIRIDTVIRRTKKDQWRSNKIKTREIKNALREECGDTIDLDKLMELVKNQHEY